MPLPSSSVNTSENASVFGFWLSCNSLLRMVAMNWPILLFRRSFCCLYVIRKREVTSVLFSISETFYVVRRILFRISLKSDRVISKFKSIHSISVQGMLIYYVSIYSFLHEVQVQLFQKLASNYLFMHVIRSVFNTPLLSMFANLYKIEFITFIRVFANTQSGLFST